MNGQFKEDGTTIGETDAPQPQLGNLVDVQSLQSMMDDFYALTRIPMSLIALDGSVVVGAGWQDVCTRFHRVNAETCAHCVESDTVLTANIPLGTAKLYRCKNGMWDAAMPITVGGKRAGNLFTGQFFFEDEPVDLGFFRSQARRYGFAEDEYLAAVEDVPRHPRAAIELGLRFLTQLSSVISQLTFSNLERERAEIAATTALNARMRLVEELATERGVLTTIMENTGTHLAYLDPDFNFIAVNSEYAAGSGHTREELLGQSHFELFPDAENEAIFRGVRDKRESAEFKAKPFEFVDQPWRGVTFWDWRLSPVEDQEGRLQGLTLSLVDVTHSVREKRFSEALNRLNDVIHSTLDSDEIISKVVPELASAMGCEAVAVGLRDQSSRWRIIEVSGLPEGVKEGVFEDAHLPTAIEALNAGTPIAVRGPSDPGIDQGLAGTLGIQSMLMAPLSFPGHQFGVVAYAYLSGPGVFNDAQVDFAKKAAASLSLSLENARLYETEHNIADRLQEALLTLPREVPGIEFAHSYHSATEAARVGGDFYDIFELEHGRVGITIGDVAGKGLDAAVLTSLAKNAIRVHASLKGWTPEVVLSRTNEVVYRSTPMESFVTVFFGILDARNGRLLYSNAGHTTAAIIGRDGTSERAPATGPILGAFSEATFGQGEVFVEPGELLFLYTDGLTEARRDGVLLGEERVFELLQTLKGGQPREAVQSVIDEVLTYTRGQLNDDLAMMALRRL